MGSVKEGVLVYKNVAKNTYFGIVTAKFWFSDELKDGLQSPCFMATDFVVGSWREKEKGSAYPIQRMGTIAICRNRTDADIIYATRLVAVIPAEKTAMFDWNTLSLDLMADYLKQRYKFSSSGDARCIWELVQFYEKHKDDEKNAKMPTALTKKYMKGFARWMELKGWRFNGDRYSSYNYISQHSIEELIGFYLGSEAAKEL